MVQPSERRKKKKFVRTPGGKSKKVYFKRKDSEKKCAVCKNTVAGTLKASKEAKASKSKKTPSALFGGELCNTCRARVIDEAIKVREGIKKEEKVELRIRNYVKQVQKKLQG